MKSYKGTYIVCEGNEGSGKSTAIKHLKEIFPDAVFVAEPGTTPLALEMRKNIFAMERDSVTDAYLFATARADLYAQIVKPALEAGKLVISDRSWLTSMVYQGYAGTLSFDDIYNINKGALQGIVPDVCLYFNLSYEESQRRLNARQGNGGEITYFDERGREWYDTIQKGYMELPFYVDFPFEVINAAQSIPMVVSEAAEAIKKYY